MLTTTNIETLIDELKADLIITAGNVDFHAAKKELSYNLTNYGVVSKTANVLYKLGQQVDVYQWKDGEYIRIESVTINGKRTEYTVA